MASKPKPPDRLGTLERVTTPLGFFTLAILVSEAILGSLTIRASGFDLTILCVGMLVGFVTLCAMVFTLAVLPTSHNSLVGGVTKYPTVATTGPMSLTANDIRTIFVTNHTLGKADEHIIQSVMLGHTSLSFEKRVNRLVSLGFFEKEDARFNHGPDAIIVKLTEKGRSVADMIDQCSLPLLELRELGPLFDSNGRVNTVFPKPSI